LPYLARKIARAKWEPKGAFGPDAIRADALTGGCLRTRDDKLSVWECDGRRDDVLQVALALIATADHVETLHIVVVDEGELREQGLAVEQTDGLTPVGDLRSRHRDIVNLDMTRICKVAELIAGKVRGQEDACFRFVRKELEEIVRRAVLQGRVTPDQLKGSVRKAVDGS
jgi:hypothetical protein